MQEADDELADLRQYAAEVQRGKEAARKRDQEILRLRNTVNPRTGRPWTWPEISTAAGLSRLGARDAGKRLANHRKAAS